MSWAEPSGFVVALVLAAAAGAQQTLVVDPVAGPFFDLPPAVAAARPGDRIEARAGNYGGITVVRGVEIYATGAATIAFVVVTGVPQGEVVVLDGFAVPTLHQPNVEVDGCLGRWCCVGSAARGRCAVRSRSPTPLP